MRLKKCRLCHRRPELIQTEYGWNIVCKCGTTLGRTGPDSKEKVLKDWREFNGTYLFKRTLR